MTDSTSARQHDAAMAVHELTPQIPPAAAHRVTAHKTMIDTLSVSVSTLTIPTATSISEIENEKLAAPPFKNETQ